MTDRNLTVARLVEDEIEGIEIEGDAFGDLLDSLGIVPKVEKRAIVTSAKPGDDDTRAYIVSVHRVPGADGTTQVSACTCPGFKFHQVYEHRKEVHDNPEAGFERVGGASTAMRWPSRTGRPATARPTSRASRRSTDRRRTRERGYCSWCVRGRGCWSCLSRQPSGPLDDTDD
jgi:hypothetical protein